jgi:hypothetical protein
MEIVNSLYQLPYVKEFSKHLLMEMIVLSSINQTHMRPSTRSSAGGSLRTSIYFEMKLKNKILLLVYISDQVE